MHSSMKRKRSVLGPFSMIPSNTQHRVWDEETKESPCNCLLNVGKPSVTDKIALTWHKKWLAASRTLKFSSVEVIGNRKRRLGLSTSLPICTTPIAPSVSRSSTVLCTERSKRRRDGRTAQQLPCTECNTLLEPSMWPRCLTRWAQRFFDSCGRELCSERLHLRSRRIWRWRWWAIFRMCSVTCSSKTTGWTRRRKR